MGYNYGQFMWRPVLMGIAGAGLGAFTLNRWMSTWFPKPKTFTPEQRKFEEETMLLPGPHFPPKDFIDQTNVLHTRKNWPRFDRRDDDDDNKYYLTVNKAGAESSEDDE